MRLGLVDRAWARIQGLVDAQGASPEAHALTAELFLTRQWPKRARDVLNKGLAAHPDDKRLKELWDRLSEPGTTPDLDALEDDEADVPSLVTAAHHLIAAGAHTRARTLLERAHKADPDHALVSDMLWALEGDFTIDGTLAELAQRHGPDLAELADLGDEPEHTESTEIGDLGEDREKQGSFPTLFRDLEPRTEMIGTHQFDDTSEEITKVTSMADLAMNSITEEPSFTGEHTEIQHVITRKSLVEEVESETAFDLSSLQSDLTSPEMEDDDVVVMTRREDEHTATDIGATETTGQKIVLDEPTEAPARGDKDRRQADEAETWVLPPEEDRRPVVEKTRGKGADEEAEGADELRKRSGTPRPTPISDLSDPIPASSSGSSMWLFAFAGVFAVSIMIAMLLIGLGLVTG